MIDVYMKAGFRIFGLHPVLDGGVCGCGHSGCQNAGKHPIATGWQHTPDWSDEQLEFMQQSGQFKTGFAVLCNGWLIVDVDPRNGGTASLKALNNNLGVDIEQASEFVVKTGGGGLHLYFTAPDGVALQYKLRDYPGVEFKSSGYVVGASSMHKTGKFYTVTRGTPADVSGPPAKLLDLLRKPDRVRAEGRDGLTVDISTAEVAEMLKFISPDCNRDQWIRIGMGLHDAYGGAPDGLRLWDEWSRISTQKYPSPEALENQWFKFGKSANPVTLGTVIHYAEEAGWIEPVLLDNVNIDIDWASVPDQYKAKPVIDLLRPPGFVGEVTSWINDQCRYPREHLAVVSALMAVGNIAGLRWTDATSDDGAINLMAFAVAGSATGKEAIQQAFYELHEAAGVHYALHGGIKSEQEIVRNLIRHQAAYYCIDEFGLELAKLINASKRGGAPYLEAVIARLMSTYTKSSGVMLLSGDLKEEVRAALRKELAAADKAGEQERCEGLEQQLRQIDSGLKRPFLSVIGFTTPVTFDALVTHDVATNGFLGRALLVVEKDSNPRAKTEFRKREMSMQMRQTLQTLYSDTAEVGKRTLRVEQVGEQVPIKSSPEAIRALKELDEWQWSTAEEEKQTTGLESIPRRTVEIAKKVSLILAAPSALRELHHVEWAIEFAKANILAKKQLAAANSAIDKGEALMHKVLRLLDKDEGITSAVIFNRLRTHRREDIDAMIGKLVDGKKVARKTFAHKKTKAKVEKYFLT